MNKDPRAKRGTGRDHSKFRNNYVDIDFSKKKNIFQKLIDILAKNLKDS